MPAFARAGFQSFLKKAIDRANALNRSSDPYMASGSDMDFAMGALQPASAKKDEPPVAVHVETAQACMLLAYALLAGLCVLVR